MTDHLGVIAKMKNLGY